MITHKYPLSLCYFGLLRNSTGPRRKLTSQNFHSSCARLAKWKNQIDLFGSRVFKGNFVHGEFELKLIEHSRGSRNA